jgi:dihydrofolate reductase
VSCIVAVAENGVIGRENALPWRLGSDLRRFRRLTMGHPLIMGRKTFEAIGRPLPGRDNIVVTRDPGRIPRLPSVLPARSLEEAISFGEACARARHVDEMFVIGGAALFEQVMPYARRLYITKVHASPPGDVFWQPALGDGWREVEHSDRPAGPDDDFAVTDIVLERDPADIEVT